MLPARVAAPFVAEAALSSSSLIGSKGGISSSLSWLVAEDAASAVQDGPTVATELSSLGGDDSPSSGSSGGNSSSSTSSWPVTRAEDAAGLARAVAVAEPLAASLGRSETRCESFGSSSGMSSSVSSPDFSALRVEVGRALSEEEALIGSRGGISSSLSPRATERSAVADAAGRAGRLELAGVAGSIGTNGGMSSSSSS